jgi:hypothetical protein
MSQSSSAPSYAGRIRWLGAAFLVAIALWTGGWFWLAGTLEKEIRKVADAGRFTCTDLVTRGYPFRMGLTCSKVALPAKNGGPAVELTGLRTAAQIYDPRHIIAEADTAAVTWADVEPILINWTLAQASVRAKGVLPDRASLVIDAPRLTRLDATPLGGAAKAELHIRRAPRELRDNAIDIALELADAAPQGGPKFTLSGDASLSGASRIETTLAARAPLSSALRGNSGELRSLTLGLADGGSLKVSGPFSFSTEGFLSATLAVRLENASNLVVGLAGLSAALGLPAPDLSPIAAMASGGTLELIVTIRDGAAAIGFIPLGQIPPV